MKIMMLTGAMDSGGAQTHIFELARGLVKRGHRVILVSGGGQMARALSRCGVRCYRVGIDAKAPLSVMSAYAAMKIIVARESPDIIHAHTRAFGVLCRVLTRKNKGRSPFYISTVHARFDNSGLVRSIPWYSGASIAVGEDLKQYLIDTSRGAILPERVEVIPNGIDTARFVPVRRTDTGFRICFMSRLDADCSLAAHLLCDAAEQICKMNKNAEIYIIGGGSEFLRISEKADAVNKAIGRLAIRMLGNLDAPEKIIARCDCFVGVSRAALEAMSCGVPVILAGNEGFFGLMRDDRDLNLASASNFCCRGWHKPTKQLLIESLCDFYFASNRQKSAWGKLMRAFVLRNNSSETMASRTEAFYLRQLSRSHINSPDTLLCGYYGFGNLGDDALLMRAAERAGDNAVALAHDPKKTEFKFGIRCVNRSNLFAVLKAIKKCRRFVLGGGSLLQSATSFRSLCWYSLLFIYASLKGKRTEIWAGGIGEFSGDISKMLAAKALRRADLVGIRDETSLALAQKLIPDMKHKIVFERDLALSCPQADSKRIAFLLWRLGMSESDDLALIAVKGFKPSKLLDPRVRRQIKLELQELYRQINAQKKLGRKLVFVAMHPKRDQALCSLICRKSGGSLALGIGISDLSGLISRSRSVISMRYHPLVLAADLNIPLSAIGNDQKLKEFSRFLKKAW